MSKAKIEIKARNVNGLGDNAQHMYIVYTKESGEEKVMSGFPKVGNTTNGAVAMLIGDVYVQDILYDDNSDDFDEYNTHTSQTIFQGTDAEVMEKVQLMKNEAKRINNEGYDYNVPIIETIIPSWGDLNDQS